jgi:hypothetical protein
LVAFSGSIQFHPVPLVASNKDSRASISTCSIQKATDSVAKKQHRRHAVKLSSLLCRDRYFVCIIMCVCISLLLGISVLSCVCVVVYSTHQTKKMSQYFIINI